MVKTQHTLTIALFCLLVSLPFFLSGQFLQEGFEASSFPPAGWVTANVSGTNQWVRTTAVKRTGEASAFINYQQTGGEDWLFTPITSIGSGDSLEFYILRQFSSPFPPDSLIIWVGSDPHKDSMTSVIRRINVSTTSSTIWNRFSASLAQFNGSDVVIGFQHKNIDGNGLYLDDVKIIKLPGTNCDFPRQLNFLPVAFNGVRTSLTGNFIQNTPCGSALVSGNDFVYRFNSFVNFNVRLDITNFTPGTTVQVFDNCPTNPQANCIASGNGINPSISYINFLNGQSYFIVISSIAGVDTSIFDFALSLITPDSITTVQSGNWSDSTIWSNGVGPSALSAVSIQPNHTVLFNKNEPVYVRNLYIKNNAQVNFDASLSRNLNVLGNLIIENNGNFNFNPISGNAPLQLFLRGNLVNNGTANFSMTNSPQSSLTFNGVNNQSISGNGTFSGGGFRNVTINTFGSGVNLQRPMVVFGTFVLRKGSFSCNNNLTLNNNSVSGISKVVLTRSSNASLIGNPTISSGAIYEINYKNFNSPFGLITTGFEIPTNRSINSLVIDAPQGVLIGGGDLTLSAASNALVLNSGVVFTGTNKIIFGNNNYSFSGSGSDSSYVDGEIRINVNSNTAVGRTVPIGSNGFYRPFGFTNLNTNSQTISASVKIVNAPSGNFNTPLTYVYGKRSYFVQSTNFPTGGRVRLSYGIDDSLFIGTNNSLRIAQSLTDTGVWASASSAQGTGLLSSSGVRETNGINLANGQYFAFASVIGPDIQVLAVDTPSFNGCNTSTQTLIVKVRNNGTQINFANTPITVKANIISPNTSAINLSQSVNSGVLGTGAIQTVVFNNTFNMEAAGNYQFTVFSESTIDLNKLNDTIRTERLRYDYQVIASPDTINFGSSVNLIAKSPDDPALSPFKISELILNRLGLGATSSYPTYIPAAAQDFMEISNLSNQARSLEDFQLQIFGDGARTYQFTNDAIIPAGGTLILHIGTGNNNIIQRYFNTGGPTNMLNDTSISGFVLYDTSGLVIDAISINGFVFPSASNVSSTDFSGSISVFAQSAGISLTLRDVNSPINWNVSSASLSQSLGVYNSGLLSSIVPVFAWINPGGSLNTGNPANSNPVLLAGNQSFLANIIQNPGCTTSVSSSIFVLNPQAPIANFGTANPNVGTSVGVLMVDSSTNFPSSWQWTVTPNTIQYLNGTSANSQNPVIRYFNPGIYTVKLVVSNPSGIDSITRVNYIDASLTYCPSQSTNVGDTKIDSFFFESIATGAAFNTCESYTNYYQVPAPIVERGSNYSFRLKHGSCSNLHYPAIVKIFVDWNKDGSFLDANEQVFVSTVSTNLGDVIGGITVPSNAAIGILGMRVIIQETTNPNSVVPCGNYFYGETEDYYLEIAPSNLNPFTILSPSNNTFLNLVGLSTQTQTFNWTSSNPGVTYQWIASLASTGISFPQVYFPTSSLPDTSAVIDYGFLNGFLNNVGVNIGDTVNVVWSALATNAQGSNRVADTSFNIRIYRGVVGDTIFDFALLNPTNNQSITLNGLNTQPVTFIWNRAATASLNLPTYQLLFDLPNGNFSSPISVVNLSGGGLDTSITLSFGFLDTLLQAQNVGINSNYQVKWAVRATEFGTSRISGVPFLLNLNRQVVYTDTLSAFQTIDPVNFASVLSIPNSSQTVSFVWNKSERSVPSSVTYQFLLDSLNGNFSTPISVIASNTAGLDTVLFLALGQINSLLVSSGVPIGGSLTLKWAIRANSSNLFRLSDAKQITLIRGSVIDTISRFNILQPNNNVRVVLQGSPTQTVDFSWNTATRLSGGPILYSLFADPNGSFGSPLLNVLSNNSGFDTSLNLDYGTISQNLAFFGVQVFDSIDLQWTINASAVGIPLNRLAEQVYTIRFVRDLIISTNVIDGIGNATFKLFPNPTKGRAFLDFNLPTQGNLNIRILDYTGRLISEEQLRNVTYGTHNLDLQGFSPGYYLIQVVSNKGVQNFPLLITE